ncbi:MAG: exosortase system-associated protein, TIGR04073 family [Candidatus Omnitrophica bacterium]|nr:exosortase system-associated protein, TIGR04073 family [Candidatus Omnitrophota bacterium]
MSRGAVVALCLAATGCIFDPFGTRVRRVQSQVTMLEQRVVQLESATGVLPSSAAETDFGVAEAAETAAPAALSLPGISQSEPLGKSQLPSVPINWRKAFGKLWRGVVNVLTGWVEVPKRIDETSTRSGPGSGATLGVLRGVGHGFVRTIAGAYDTVTFVFPAPPDYAPLIQPEYVFTCACEPGWSAAGSGSP